LLAQRKLRFRTPLSVQAKGNPMNEKNEELKNDAPESSMKFWRELAKSMLKGSIESIESTAKQIIAICGILEGIYFHAITYSDIRGYIGTLEGVFYLAPLFLWLLSILFAVLVFSPKVYHTNIASGRESKATFLEIVTKKHKRLRIAQTIFFISFIFLLIAMGLYLW
jgi:hypothetical protein